MSTCAAAPPSLKLSAAAGGRAPRVEVDEGAVACCGWVASGGVAAARQQRRRLKGGELGLSGPESGHSLIDVVHRLMGLGSRGLRRPQGVLGGLIGRGLARQRALLERLGILDRVEQLRGGRGASLRLLRRRGAHRRCFADACELTGVDKGSTLLAGKHLRSRPQLGHRQEGAGDFDRGRVTPRDHDAVSDLRHAPELLGEPISKPDATMRGRIARDHAQMHGNAGPRDALHKRHRCAAVDVGMVPALFPKDAEQANRRGMPPHAGGNARLREAAGAVVDSDMLIGE